MGHSGRRGAICSFPRGPSHRGSCRTWLRVVDDPAGARRTGIKHTMRILALNASHRAADGHTQILLARLARGARGAGAVFEILLLSELRIDRCLACQKCQTHEHYLKCVIDDDVAMVHRKMAEADIIIYATPVYVFGMSGLLKAFLDRLRSTGDSNNIRLTQRPRVSSRRSRHLLEALRYRRLLSQHRGRDSSERPPLFSNVLPFHGGSTSRDSRAERGRASGRRSRSGSGTTTAAPARAVRSLRASRSRACHDRQGSLVDRAAREPGIVAAPLFGLLKRVPLRMLKAKFVAHARNLRTSDH